MGPLLSNLHISLWVANLCGTDAGTSEHFVKEELTTGVSTKPATTDGSAPSVPDTTTITSAALTAAQMHSALQYALLCICRYVKAYKSVHKATADTSTLKSML